MRCGRRVAAAVVLGLAFANLSTAQDMPAEYQRVLSTLGKAGDYEVTPVLKALREHGLDVVAIHHHMTDTQPTIFFLHYWGTGVANTLAAGVRAAIDQTARPRASK